MASTVQATLARWLVVWLLCVQALTPTRASDEAPQVDPSSALITLRVQGTSYANIRVDPDPRSQMVMQLPAGSTNLRATGATRLYGDTWWIEIQSGNAVGWLNARLVGRGPQATPLQPFINIDALARLNDYAFLGSSTREATATSFDECARRCMRDDTCLAIEYENSTTLCKFIGEPKDLVRKAGSDVASKPSKIPPGGWIAQSPVRFDRQTDQAPQSASYRNTLTQTPDECSVACALDDRCRAFTHHRKKRLCAVYDNASSLTTSAGLDLGLRRSTPAVADVIAPQAPLLTPSRTAAKEQPLDTRSLREQFIQIFADAGQSAIKATVELQRQGRIAVSMEEPPLGTVMHAAALPRTMEGTLQNLAAVIGRTDGRIVHIVYYALPTSSPVILASTTYDSTERAHVAGLKLQSDIDALAKLAGLGFDPLSLLKPLRR